MLYNYYITRLETNNLLLSIKNVIFAKLLFYMIETFLQITAVVNKLKNKPLDIIASYLAMTEILKILSDNKIINYNSYIHLKWMCDYKIMCSTLKDVPKREMIECIAEEYNRSYQAIEKVVYNLGGKK